MSQPFEINKNLPSSTLEALEKEISEVLATCSSFVENETKVKLRQLNRGKLFDYDTNTNIELLARDMTCILEGIKEYLTTNKAEQEQVKKKVNEIRHEKNTKGKPKDRDKGEGVHEGIREERDLTTVTEKGEEKLAQRQSKQEKDQEILIDGTTTEEKYDELQHAIKKVEVAEQPTSNKGSSQNTLKSNKNVTRPYTPVINKMKVNSAKLGNEKETPNKTAPQVGPKTSKNALKKDELKKNTNRCVENFSEGPSKKGPECADNSMVRLTERDRSKSRVKEKPRSKSRESNKSQRSSVASDDSKTTNVLYQKQAVVPTNENFNKKLLSPPKVNKNKCNSESPLEFANREKLINSVSKADTNQIQEKRRDKSNISNKSSERPKSANTNPTKPVINNPNKNMSSSSSPRFGTTTAGSGKVGSSNSSMLSSTPLGNSRVEKSKPLLNTSCPVYSSATLKSTSSLSFRRKHPIHMPREIYNPMGVLRDEVEMAIQERKTFTVTGHFGAVRQALLKRGWIEKIHASYRNSPELKSCLAMTTQELLDLARLSITHQVATKAIKSKLLGTNQVDFYWCCNYDAYSECSDKSKLTLINKLRWKSLSYTSKHGLSEASRHSFWFQIPGVSKLNVPRSYRLAKEGDAEEFVKDFNLTAAMSLLKWIKNRSEVHHSSIMTPNGRVPLRMFDFAINECYKYLKRARHEDIDQEIKEALAHEWNEFLEYFYKIVHVGNHFKSENHVSEVDMLRRVNYVLSRLKEHWPYFDMDGEFNIWIMKPTNSCRGIGIHMCRTLKYVLDTVKANPNRRYIIQKYIERPLLIHNTKFDIRQYFLISSCVPVTIWFYKVCYLRFSSQMFNMRKLHESIHLTNNAVQSKYKHGGYDKRIPPYGMWDSNQFKQYLIDIGQPKVYNEIIYRGMKESITAAVLMHQENMEKRKNSFEVYGADFMITEDFRPWLLEINANPALGSTTPITAKICPRMLEDVIKVVVDYERNKNMNTGDFELIYKGTIRKELKCNDNINLMVDGKPLSPDYFYKVKWTPKEEMNKEINWGTKVKIKNLSKNPDTVDFGLVSVAGMKKTLQSLLELLKKEKERRKLRGISISQCPYTTGVDRWRERRKSICSPPQLVP